MHSLLAGKSAGMLLLAATFAVIVAGCRTYKPMPLTTESVEKTLAVPSDKVVREEAANLNHPILQPVEFDLNDGFSPDEAAVFAVLVNPDLRAARDGRGIAEAQVMQAKILPNPQISYGLDVPTGGNDQGEINAYGLGLSWDVSALIRNATSPKAAEAERQSVDLDIAWQEWQTAQAAKISVYRLYALGQETTLARENAGEQKDSLEFVRRGYDAGQVTSQDLYTAEDSYNQALSLIADLEKESGKETATLKRLLGLPPEAEIRLQEDIELPSRFDPPSPEDLLAGLEDRRLDLLALRKGYESEEQTLHGAVLSQFPPVTLGVNHARDTGNVITTGFSVDIDLPIFDRNQAGIALEKATRQQLFDEYAARLADARSSVNEISIDVTAINRQLETNEETLKNLGQMADSYKSAYQKGLTKAYDYYGVLGQLLGRKLEVVALKEQLMEARIALELATGLYRIEDREAAVAPSGKEN